MKKEEKSKSLVAIANEELNKQIADPGAMRALTATIFKGFKDEKIVKQACLEIMLRGYSFEDILNKKIYAVPFAGSYAIIPSISDVRTTAMRSGLAGKSAPEFEFDDNGKIISCTVTVKRKVDDYVGDYTATVYFEEYNTNRNEWINKPKTMIAKVAEMHALRMAFPEELSQAYSEEEFQKQTNSKSDEINERIEEKKRIIEEKEKEKENLKVEEVEFDEEEYKELIEKDDK